MKRTYDLCPGIACPRLREKAGEVETPGPSDDGRPVVVDEASGRERVVELMK